MKQVEKAMADAGAQAVTEEIERRHRQAIGRRRRSGLYRAGYRRWSGDFACRHQRCESGSDQYGHDRRGHVHRRRQATKDEVVAGAAMITSEGVTGVVVEAKAEPEVKQVEGEAKPADTAAA